MSEHRPTDHAPPHIEHIPLSKQWVGKLGVVALLTALAGISFYTGLMSEGWTLHRVGARVGPAWSKILVTLLGGLLTLGVANQLTKLLTLCRTHPFDLRFGSQALVLPTVTFWRGLRSRRIPWTDIKAVTVRRGKLTEVVDIRTATSGTITLPGQFCGGQWRPARIAEAIRQEAARRGAAIFSPALCGAARGERSPAPD